MGGIGKTTLAQTLYHHPSSASHFDARAWVTLSPVFNLRLTLLALIGCLVKLTDEMCQEDDDRLGLHVHQTLINRRYLIVVDDVWDTNAWDKLSTFFPSERKGILLTTRLETVADYVRPSGNHYRMHPIDKDASWELLERKVFREEPCPPELVEIGKRIADNRRGLPLALSTLGGLLSGREKSLEFWEHVERNIHSEITDLASHCLEILSKSYNYLPYYLKPCFLYVGAFPEKIEIQSSKIIKLWVSEGFVRPIVNNRLEDTAESHLKDLIDANLLSVWQKEPNGKVKSFKIHDLLREFCLVKAAEEKFLWFKSNNDNNIQDEDIMRRVSVLKLSKHRNETELMSPLRSFLYIGLASEQLADMVWSLRLLRVLDILQIEFCLFPKGMLELVNLRYLAFTYCLALPSSISIFRNLQSLIIGRKEVHVVFPQPSELWDVTQLKHIKSKGRCTLCYPEEGEYVDQEVLQTLSNIKIKKVTDGDFQRFPNLRKLGIFYDAALDTDINLTLPERLETLKCSSSQSPVTGNFLSHLILPHSLKKLTLHDCKIPLGFMERVGSLPNLERLKLLKVDFPCILWEQTETEPKQEQIELGWEPAEGEFPRLKSLVMEDLDLVHWRAEETPFSKLQRLLIRNCFPLREMSLDMVEVETLELIDVDDSSRAVLAWVNHIKEEKKDSGKVLPQVVGLSAY